MRIVFDGFWWQSGPPSTRHVLRETIFTWLKMYPDDVITVIVRRKHRAMAEREIGSRTELRSTRWWPHAFANVLTGTRLGRHADVVFAQNFAVPTRAMSVAFVHDVLFLSNPEWFTRLERAYFRLMSVLARRADLVLTSSRSEADRIARYTSATVVVPVGIGMSDELADADPVRPAFDVTPGSYLLTVGRLNIRKNLAKAIEAAIRSDALSRSSPLVVVGAGDGRPDTLSPAALQAIDDGRVVMAGYVSDSELAWLYSNAALFLFLTRGEGFGMPAVEAAHFGVPSILSDLPVLREIAPSAVAWVDPDDVDAIAEAIARSLAVSRPRGSLEDSTTIPTWGESVTRMRSAIVRHRTGNHA